MQISRQGPFLVVHAPAKLNLYLNVLGRRRDGFHDLETVMVSIRLYDTIQFASSSSLDLRCRSCLTSGTELAVDGDNLILRAARLLQSKTGTNLGADISLVKRIPIQAGLGGGSSDAAATLVGLNRLWELGLSVNDLHGLAAQLGSDVNFFLDDAVASMCRGRGEQTEVIPVNGPLHFVVVKPDSGLSTGAVFQKWGQDSSIEKRSMDDVRSHLMDGNANRLCRDGLVNCLEAPARALNPEIDGTLEVLNQMDVLAAAMTGSGSSCFAICRSARHAQRVAARVRAADVGTVIAVGSGV